MRIIRADPPRMNISREPVANMTVPCTGQFSLCPQGSVLPRCDTAWRQWSDGPCCTDRLLHHGGAHLDVHRRAFAFFLPSTCSGSVRLLHLPSTFQLSLLDICNLITYDSSCQKSKGATQ